MQTVKILNLTKSFGKIRAVDSLSLDIEKGKITGLIGADGSGKTTLIRLITGLLIPELHSFAQLLMVLFYNRPSNQ